MTGTRAHQATEEEMKSGAAAIGWRFVGGAGTRGGN